MLKTRLSKQLAAVHAMQLLRWWRENNTKVCLQIFGAAEYKKILNADYTIPDFVSEECRSLITSILNTDPEKRMTLEQIKDHVWYK